MAWSDPLAEAGYEPEVRFNSLHGHERLLHSDRANDLQLDTFVGLFEMCHVLDLDRRLHEPGPSITPADLLLTKLQLVELNRKDYTGALLLLAEHPITSDPVEGLEPMRLQAVLGDDWGWYTTVRTTSRKDAGPARRRPPPSRPDSPAAGSARHASPRTLRWRMESLIGRRLPWYDLPEEVSREP